MNDVDVAVIGAGIHGAGVAQALAAAGYSVFVVEKNTVGSGTSCKSSKLIHGGLRYLESYQFSLVRKSLKERAVLCRIAPDLVKLQPFYIPVYKNTSRRPWQIRLGLSLYALLGGLHKNNLFKRVAASKLAQNDGLNKKDLQKVYRYYDGQTNDKKLTQAVMKSAQKLGAQLACPVTLNAIIKNENDFTLSYNENNEEKNIRAKLIVNAAGPWVNEVHHLVSANDNLIKLTSLEVDLVQGTHIIIDVPAPAGIYYLEAADHRAVFVMPYEFNGEQKTLVGTTEKLFDGLADDVNATEGEVAYLLNVYHRYFPDKAPLNVLHQFAGLRVLPINDGSLFSRPRDTVLHWAMPGLLTLYGGKLTAYRSTSDLVVKKLKPFLARRQRIADTENLPLSL